MTFSLLTRRMKFSQSWIYSIGVGNFKNLGGARFRILGGVGKGEPNSQQAHDVALTSCDVTTSHRRHFDVMCPLDF